MTFEQFKEERCTTCYLNTDFCMECIEMRREVWQASRLQAYAEAYQEARSAAFKECEEIARGSHTGSTWCKCRGCEIADRIKERSDA